MRKSVFLLSLFVLPLYMLLQAQEKTTPFWGKQEVYLINQTEKTFGDYIQLYTIYIKQKSDND